MNTRHTYEMGIIGNCHFLAYVDKTTNVTWQCWPKFDSTFIFGSLLDEKKGGKFQISPTSEIQETKQYYVENTNILCTEIITNEGSYRVTDFAPRFSQFDRFYKPLMLIRKIEHIDGNPGIQIFCEPRGNYGELVPRVSIGSNHIRYQGLEDQVRLTTDIPLNFVVDSKPFVLSQPQYLVLTWGVPLEAPLQETVESYLRKTTDYWRNWVESCSTPQIYQRAVIRSSLALKLHQYEDTGAIIASGTTSLPESPGSGRNWDYRYFWVRDTYYTLQAFNDLGHFEELGKYAQFLQNIAAHNSGIKQPMYTILGDSNIPERELPLKGYKGNGPVRVGNAAYFQVQNDVFGQAILSLLPLYIDERIVKTRRMSDTKLIYQLLENIEKVMEDTDAGLWEFREKKAQHCYTYLFHWAGACAAQKIGNYFKDSNLKTLAEKTKTISAKKIEECYNPQLRCYASAVGGKDLDSALFHLVTMGYLDPSSPRALEHVEALDKALSADNRGLFYRYRHHDDFGVPDVAFLVCGFWYVSALANMNKMDKAIKAFERLLDCTNHLGLMSEDIAFGDLSQWGNFVQTYSHVGLINSAFQIDRKLNRPNFLL